MIDATPAHDPYAPLILTAWVDADGHVVINGDGVPLLKMERKQTLHLIARLAVAVAAEGVSP